MSIDSRRAEVATPGQGREIAFDYRHVTTVPNRMTKQKKGEMLVLKMHLRGARYLFRWILKQ